MKASKIIHYLIPIVILSTFTNKAKAQLTGMQAVYFENQYLANPAMAGTNKGLNLNTGYQAQWNALPGGPKIQYFTADYNAGDRVGLGMMINNDEAGLISKTRVMATYAYHLPLSMKENLSFGLSAGISDSYIDYSKINGDQGDVNIDLFNQRRIYVDGDLGIAYTATNGLDLQAVIPNIGSVFFKADDANLDVDRTTFYTSASYKFRLYETDNNFVLEPKIVYRGIKGFAALTDFGANLTMDEYHINFTGMYHSNKSITTSVGLNLKPVRVLFSYTSNYGPLSPVADNALEFGLKYTIMSR